MNESSGCGSSMRATSAADSTGGLSGRASRYDETISRFASTTPGTPRSALFLVARADTSSSLQRVSERPELPACQLLHPPIAGRIARADPACTPHPPGRHSLRHELPQDGVDMHLQRVAHS